MNAIIVDKEFESLIPPLSANEREQLEHNILRDGCREPITLWGDILIDGHNRYSICRDHGILFERVQAAHIQSREDAIEWIADNQLGRRNLTDYERVVLASRRKDAIASRAAQKMKIGTAEPFANVGKGSGALHTNAEIGKVAGVGKESVRKALSVEEHGGEEVRAAARKGEVSINKAAEIAKLPKKEQAEALKKPAVKKKAATKPPPAPTPKEVEEAALDAAAFEGFDPIEELSRVKAELARAYSDIEAMQADDLKKEVLKWKHAAKIAENTANDKADNALRYHQELQKVTDRLTRIGKLFGGERDTAKVVALVEDFYRKHSKVSA